MKNIITTLLLLTHSGTLLAASDPAVGNPEMGRSKAIICVGCHGFDGNSSNDIYPKLAEQNESYLTKQLLDFKTGARKEEHMSSMVEAIDAIDILDIAAFFSIQKRNSGSIENGAAEKTKRKLGKKIYHSGIPDKNIPACASCHGNKGAGNQIKIYPSLVWQHAQYITKALKEFRSGTRSNDPVKTMRNIANNLSDTEIDALSAYIESLN